MAKDNTMTQYSVRPLPLITALLGLAGCAAQTADGGNQAAVAPAPDLGASSRAPARVVLAAARMPQATANDATMLAHDAHADMPATGVVNAVDVARRKINISHEPIPAISWPSMTMEFPVASSVDLGAVKPGARVNFRLRKGAGDMYEVTSVRALGR